MTNNQRNELADLIGQVPYHQSDDPQPIYTPPTRYEIADALIAAGVEIKGHDIVPDAGQVCGTCGRRIHLAQEWEHAGDYHIV